MCFELVNFELNNLVDFKTKKQSRSGGNRQLSKYKCLQLLRKTTREVRRRPALHRPPSKHPNMVKKFARQSFAEVASKEPACLRFSKYGTVLGRPECVPSSNYYFRELEKDPYTAAAVKNLYRAVAGT